MTNRTTLDLPQEFAKTLGDDAARETLVAAVLRSFEEANSRKAKPRRCSA